MGPYSVGTRVRLIAVHSINKLERSAPDINLAQEATSVAHVLHERLEIAVGLILACDFDLPRLKACLGHRVQERRHSTATLNGLDRGVHKDQFHLELPTTGGIPSLFHKGIEFVGRLRDSFFRGKHLTKLIQRRLLFAKRGFGYCLVLVCGFVARIVVVSVPATT